MTVLKNRSFRTTVLAITAVAFAAPVFAGTIGMDNRDDRRGDRQECRIVEGAAGADKRDCKQDSR